MEVKLDRQTVEARHPQLVTQVIAELQAKAAKGGKPLPDLSQWKWLYSWAVRMGANSQGWQDNCFVSLCAKAGRRRVFVPLFDNPGHPTPAHLIPQEIHDVHQDLNERVSSGAVAHACTFNIRAITGQVTRNLALAGYKDKKGNTTITHVKENPRRSCLRVPICLRIEGATAVWIGGLRKSAKARFDATPEGGLFRYRNKPFIRLTGDEIRALVENRTFQISFY